MGGASEVLDVGRATRTIPPAIRRALIARDQGCVWPGCERAPIGCDGHHIQHWINDGPTSLTNLALLCHSHHHRLHEHNLMRAPPTGTSPTRHWMDRHTSATPHARPTQHQADLLNRGRPARVARCTPTDTRSETHTARPGAKPCLCRRSCRGVRTHDPRCATRTLRQLPIRRCAAFRCCRPR